MRKSTLFNFGLSLVTLTLCLTTPTAAQAQELSLPTSLWLPGLTFETPIYAHPDISNDVGLLSSIDFKETEPLLIEQETSSVTTLVDLLVPPSMATESTPSAEVEATSLPSPVLGKAEVKAAVVEERSDPSDQPTETPKATTTAKPTSTPRVVTGGLNPDKLFEMVNNYRTGKGLPAFQKDSRACELAASRAPEINNEIAEGHMHSGLRARNLPYWNSENIISMNSEEAAFAWWVHDQIHKEAIESDKVYSCVACAGNACVQEFTSFTPK